MQVLRERQVAPLDSQALLDVVRIELRSPDARVARSPDVGLGRDGQAGLLRVADHLADTGNVAEARAVQVADVGVCARRRRQSQQLDVVLVAGVGLQHRQVLHVRVRRSVVLGGHLPQLVEFGQRGPWRVPPRHADPDGTFSQTLLGQLEDLLELLALGDRLDPDTSAQVAEHEVEGRHGLAVDGEFWTQDHAPSEPPPGGDAEVERPPLLLGVVVELTDREDARLQLEHRRHAVIGLHPVARDALAVAMGVDEARRDDQPRDVDHLLALERRGRDGHDPVAGDPHVENPVRVGLRVDHPAVGEDDVVLLIVLRHVVGPFVDGATRRGLGLN